MPSNILQKFKPKWSSGSITTKKKIILCLTMIRKKQKNIKCKRCTGWGHYKAQCPTKQEVCYGCGSTDHKYNACKFKLLKINKVDIQEEDENESSATENHEDDVNNRISEVLLYTTKIK
eukprot:snap_masked-scaffold_3-processed-gene-13.29-mRNA-1 protein AED:1.00 eAED:1.00 QI:0/0/0/0/1/1/2/0/118